MIEPYQGFVVYELEASNAARHTNNIFSRRNQRSNVIKNYLAELNAVGFTTADSVEQVAILDTIYFSKENLPEGDWFIIKDTNTFQGQEAIGIVGKNNKKEGKAFNVKLLQLNQRLKNIGDELTLIRQEYPKLFIKGFDYRENRMVPIETKIEIIDSHIYLLVPNRTSYKRATEKGYPITTSVLQQLTPIDRHTLHDKARLYNRR